MDIDEGKLYIAEWDVVVAQEAAFRSTRTTQRVILLSRLEGALDETLGVDKPSNASSVTDPARC